MSVILLTGTPGTGKTISSLEHHILPAIKEKRVVYHNIRGVNHHTLGAYLGIEYTQVKRLCVFIGGEDEQTVVNYLTSVPEGALTVIDEAHRYFGGGKYKKLDGAKEFISIHRHHGNDVILITQHPNDIWSGILTRVEQTHVLRLHPTKNDKSYQDFVYVGFKTEGSHLFVTDKTFNPKMFSLYQSRQFTEKKQKSNKISPWKNPKVKKLIIVTVVFVSIGVYMLAKNGIPLLNRMNTETETTKETTNVKKEKISVNGDLESKQIFDKLDGIQNKKIQYTQKFCSNGLCTIKLSSGDVKVYPQMILEDSERMPVRFVPVYPQR